MKLIKITVVLLSCLLAGIVFSGVQRLRKERVMLDELMQVFNDVKKHIPAKAAAWYFSNYNPDFKDAYYYQSQFAMAPQVLMRGEDKQLNAGDYAVLVNSSDAATALPPKQLEAYALDTLYSTTVTEKQFRVQVFKIIK